MKKKIIFALMALAVSATAITGCGASASQDTTTTETSETDTQTDASGDDAQAETSEDTTADASEADTQTENPWITSDKEGVLAATGFEMEAPEGATDVLYYYLEDEKLAQMDYSLDGMTFVYRMQMADEFTDISGMEYDWDSENDGTVSNREAKYYSYVGSDTEDSVQMVNWYDIVPGVMYSLSATGSDLDGMDIQYYAENIFVPLQDDVG